MYSVFILIYNKNAPSNDLFGAFLALINYNIYSSSNIYLFNTAAST